MDKHEAARMARRAYQKKWRASNPEKVKAATERYWIRQGERLAQQAEIKEGEDAHDEE